jgi:signal peptidase
LIVVLGVGALAIAVPAVTGSTALTVETSSMEPTLPPGTMIVIRPVKAEDIAPGDIITYQLRSGEPVVVTHRVAQQLTTTAGELLFVTRGDRNPAPDPDPVRPPQVRGELWYAIPIIGWLSAILSGEIRTVLSAAVITMLLGYAAWMIVSSVRDRAKLHHAD